MISIIIPTYDRSLSLRQALESVIKQDYPRQEYEVLVVDNGVTDTIRDVVDEICAQNKQHLIRYIHEPVPGLLSGRHRGAAESQGNILVFIDDDIQADICWLSAISDAFQDQETHLVGGRNLPNYASPPPEWETHLWTREGGNAYCTYYSLLDLGPKRIQIDPNYVWGLNFSIRKETLYRLGGFHPDATPPAYQRYQGDGETGLTLKLKAQGLKSVYEPLALVSHLVSKERLSWQYLEKRSFYAGVCDSYTNIRGKHNFQYIQQYNQPVKTPKDVIENIINSAYVRGYNFHQSEVMKDPTLLGWVLRDDYFDYRYPE